MSNSIITSLTCKYCNESLNIANNNWNHKCFKKLSSSEYVLVSNDENEVFPTLTSNLKAAEDTETNKIDELSDSPVNNDSSNKGSEKISQNNQDSFDESLIVAVQKRRPLWDHKNIPPEERTHLKKNIHWLAVCKMISTKNVEHAKKRWEYLRGKYMKTRKVVLSYKPSGAAASGKKHPSETFKFYALMQFLNDSTDPVPTISSMDSTANTTMFDLTDNEEAGLEEPIIPDFYKKKSRKRQMAEVNDFDTQILSCLKDNKTLDGVDGFLIQVGEIIRKVPEESRLQLQIEVLVFLNEKKKELSS